jgi:ABC-type transport system involved in multi-copper enzyme maturation permease subunit
MKWLLLYLFAFTFCTACTLFAIAILFSYVTRTS